jgi:hypothetical protein
MLAVRSFLDAGVRITQTSDYPPGPFEPMMALQSSVTRTESKGQLWGPRQRVTVEEALRAGTLHGAYASHEEHIKGSVEAGKLADLVVLGRDPRREDPPSSCVSRLSARWLFEAYRIQEKSKGKRQKVGTDLFQSQQGSEIISILLPFDFCLLIFLESYSVPSLESLLT